LARQEAIDILGFDPGFSAAAQQEQFAEGEALAAQRDAELAPTTTVGTQRRGFDQGLDISKNDDGSFTLTNPATGESLFTGSFDEVEAENLRLISGSTPQPTGFFAPKTVELIDPQTGETTVVEAGSEEMGSLLAEGAQVTGESVPEALSISDDEITTISSDLLSEALTDVTTEADLQNIFTAQQALIDSMQPTEEILDLRTQLSDIRAQADMVTQSLLEGVNVIEDQPIPMQFITGQAASIERRANATLSNIQRAEAALLENLGIEISLQEAQQAAAAQNYSFLQDNLNLAFQVQDRAIAEEERVFNRAQQLSAAAQDTFTSMLSMFEGYSFDQLSTESQSSLTKLALDAGIPMSLVEDGMKAVQSSMLLDETALGDLTQSQFLAGGFTVRMEQAEQALADLEKDGFLSKLSLMDQAQLSLPAFAQSEDVQLYQQAQDNFITAVLRKESGAAISEEEYARAERQYFPQAGDSQATLDQKAENRSTVTAAMKLEAGEAYTALSGSLDFTPSGEIGVSALEPLTQVYGTLDELVEFQPEYLPLIQELSDLHEDATDQEILDALQGEALDPITGKSVKSTFSQDLSTSLNGSPRSVLDLGVITGFGSDLWDKGLDIDLEIGDPVPSPAVGVVEYAGKRGDFGNQVRIRTADGNSVWLSHLDEIGVSVGDQIGMGQVIGTGGNTGETIPGPGNNGSHLDLTVQKSDGSFFSPEEIYERLKSFA